MLGWAFSRRIAIDHLLQHQSGIGELFTDTEIRVSLSVLMHPNRQYSPKRIMESRDAYGLNDRPRFKLGEGHSYSDMH